jgi:hypothetical protein
MLVLTAPKFWAHKIDFDVYATLNTSMPHIVPSSLGSMTRKFPNCLFGKNEVCRIYILTLKPSATKGCYPASCIRV